MNKVKLLLIAILFTITAWPANANAGDLYIRNIQVVLQDSNKATITWTTSLPSRSRVLYGTTVPYSQFSGYTDPNSTYHEVTLYNLRNEFDYHFQIVAVTATNTVESFDQTFKTKNWPSTTPLELSDVRTSFVSGTVMTVEWKTNRASDSVVEVVTSDDAIVNGFNKPRKVRNGAQVTEHEVTVKGLKKDTSYSFRVRSNSKDGVEVLSAPFNVRTFISDAAEKENLTITQIAPASSPDPLIGNRNITFKWHTSRPSLGYIEYQPDVKKGKKLKLNEQGWSVYDHTLTLVGLEPNTAYKVKIFAKDILGKKINTDFLYVRTTAIADAQGLVLGVQTPPAPMAVSDKPVVVSYYGATRRNLALEQSKAWELRNHLEVVYNKKVPAMTRDNWFTLVRAFTYGGYPLNSLSQAVKHGGKTVHPSIPWSTWSKSTTYQTYINK